LGDFRGSLSLPSQDIRDGSGNAIQGPADAWRRKNKVWEKKGIKIQGLKSSRMLSRKEQILRRKIQTEENV